MRADAPKAGSMQATLTSGGTASACEFSSGGRGQRDAGEGEEPAAAGAY
jgi:hypothetical protein